jgi:hypothetical protein
MAQITPHEKLRRYLGDKIEVGQDETQKFFPNAEIDSLIEEYGGDLIAAAADGWTQKASKFADLIDIDESGSTRKLTQRYRQANERARYFAQRLVDAAVASSAGFRAIAKVASLDESADEALGPYLTKIGSHGYTEVRTYPTHRMGAMKN